ncbi:MAG: ATP-binding protein [Bryobacteraceae bacterium]
MHSDGQVDWRQAVNRAGFGIAIVCGDDRRLLDVNDAFAAMHGYEPAEIVGKSLDELSAPATWKPLSFTTRANAGPRQQLYESIHARRDGTTFACITDMTPHQDGKSPDSHDGEHDPGGTRVVYFSDIIGLNRIETSVRDSEERFRSLAAALPQLIWSSSAQGALEYVNPLWRTYAGWTVDQEPPSDPWPTLLHPEDQSSYMDRWAKVLKSGDVFEIQCRLKHMPDGSYRWFLCRAVPLRNSNGEIVRWFGSCTDIQDQMNSATKLQTAVDALSRSNADLEQFAYAASHDLQEPLRMVAIYTQLLKEEYSEKLDATAAEYINFAVSGAQRMEELLKGLLSYATIANTFQESAECVDANEALNAAELNLQVTIEDTRAMISSDQLPPVWIPRVHLIRLFQNLLSNALKYRGDLDPHIHVGVRSDSSMWTFSVRDNGIGIASEYLNQIFGVFKRLHGSKYEGTGIGLAMCQKIVERAGGQIWVESQLGRGSTFFFTIPLIERGK